MLHRVRDDGLAAGEKLPSGPSETLPPLAERNNKMRGRGGRGRGRGGRGRGGGGRGGSPAAGAADREGEPRGG
eukprot:961859-Rhodomonas_salina.2